MVGDHKRRIGILALQGGVTPHTCSLQRIGCEVREVRVADDLRGLSGLVLPGGESTTQLRLIRRGGLEGPLTEFLRAGHPALATCAGLILAAQSVHDPDQHSLGWLDVDVSRNAWGRQVQSFEAMSDNRGLPLVFIRAPRIVRVGDDVSVEDTLDGEPILVRQGRLWGASFHPELADDSSVHALVFGRA